MCQSKCTCKKNPCNASGLKQCPVCKDVMKSACGKKTCCSESKPVILNGDHDILKKLRTRRLQKIAEQAVDSEGDSEDSEQAAESEGDSEDSDESDVEDNDEVDICENTSTESQSSSTRPRNQLPFCAIKRGVWIVVVYEGEYFLGQVETVHPAGCDVHSACALVTCLKKPYGISGEQEFENPQNIICYDEFYKSAVTPKSSKVGCKHVLTY